MVTIITVVIVPKLHLLLEVELLDTMGHTVNILGDFLTLFC